MMRRETRPQAARSARSEAAGAPYKNPAPRRWPPASNPHFTTGAAHINPYIFYIIGKRMYTSTK